MRQAGGRFAVFVTRHFPPVNTVCRLAQKSDFVYIARLCVRTSADCRVSSCEREKERRGEREYIYGTCSRTLPAVPSQIYTPDAELLLLLLSLGQLIVSLYTIYIYVYWLDWIARID